MLCWISVIESPDDTPVEDVEDEDNDDDDEEFKEELKSDVALVWKYHNIWGYMMFYESIFAVPYINEAFSFALGSTQDFNFA